MGIKIRQSGSWKDISGSDSNNTTYEYLLVDYGSSTGGGTGHDSLLRLKPSSGTNDDIRLIAGDNVSFGLDTTAGTLVISSSGGGGGGTGTLTDVTVDYTGRSAPCSLPITVTTPSEGTKQINIPATSNAFGAKYVQNAEPTGNTVCDGDVWYDTTPSQSLNPVTVPVGGIIMYSGTETELNALANWKLCNGLNGTPNLADKFVICGNNWETHSGTDKWVTRVETGSAPGTETGGSKDAVVVSHSHTYNTRNTGSVHSFGDSNQTRPVNSTVSADTGSEGVSGTNKNLPPYFALAYIMRIS